MLLTNFNKKHDVMILKTDKPLDKRMLPFTLRSGDMAVFQLISMRQGHEPPFIYMLRGSQRVLDPYNDEFVEARLVESAHSDKVMDMIPIRQGLIVLNGHRPEDREMFKYLMISDENESKPHRNKAVRPVFFIKTLVINNEHVEMTPDGKLVSKGADMISRKKRRTPHNLNAERSKLDTITIDGTDDYSPLLQQMREEDAKKMLYKLVDALVGEGLLDAVYDKHKGLITIKYKDDSGAEKPLLAFEGRGKGVWVNTLKSRLWKRRDDKPQVIGRVLMANEAITQEVLMTTFNGKYNWDSLVAAFPVLHQMQSV